MLLHTRGQSPKVFEQSPTSLYCQSVKSSIESARMPNGTERHAFSLFVPWARIDGEATGGSWSQPTGAYRTRSDPIRSDPFTLSMHRFIGGRSAKVDHEVIHDPRPYQRQGDSCCTLRPTEAASTSLPDAGPVRLAACVGLPLRSPQNHPEDR